MPAAKPYTLQDPPPDFWWIRENDTGTGFTYELMHEVNLETVEARTWNHLATRMTANGPVTAGDVIRTRQPAMRGAVNHFVKRELERTDLFFHPLIGKFCDWGTEFAARAERKQVKREKRKK